MHSTVLEPVKDDSQTSGRWMVVIYDNTTTPENEVEEVLILATGCSREEAEIEVWEAQAYSKASVHFDSRETCQRVAAIIEGIGVRTDVVPEWN